MEARVVIHETEANGSWVEMEARSIQHARRMCLNGLCALEFEIGDKKPTPQLPRAKIALLRGFMAAQGCNDEASVRRLLLMALQDLEDEAEGRRLVAPKLSLPVLAPT